MKQLLVVAVVALALVPAACARKMTSPSASESEKNWTVLPEKEALVLKSPCSRSFPVDLSGYWRLSDVDIGRAETRFQEALARTLRRLPKRYREASPGDWHAQYAGFFRDGHKVIYVNAVAAGVAEGQWRTRAVSICDGGLISFGAVLDLGRDTVDSFEFNGTIGGPIRMSDATDADAAQPGVEPDGPSARGLTR
jgi:hypothetical protein